MSVSSEPKSDSTGSGGQRFEPTQWTIILKAGDENAPGAQDALEKFAQIYWSPLYRFIRYEGYTRHDAQDLTQAFYHHFLEKRLIQHVKEKRGKFRSFLLTCLKHFLSDQRDRDAALKRGRGKTFVSLDAFEAEERESLERAAGFTPDQIYDRHWAKMLLARAQQWLREEYLKGGDLELYEELAELAKGGTTQGTYAEIAERLEMSEAAFKSSAHQFRLRFRKILRKEIGRTVSCREEIDEEIRYLAGASGN
jgi:RNA polymerase sigma factor (sigma-70 family)